MFGHTSCRKSRNPLRAFKKESNEDKENIILLPVDSGERDLENRAFLPPEVVMVSSIYYRIFYSHDEVVMVSKHRDRRARTLR